MDITKEILKESLIGKKRGVYDLLVKMYEPQTITMAVPILINYIERDLGLSPGVLKEQSIYSALRKKAKGGQNNKPETLSGGQADQREAKESSEQNTIPDYNPKNPFSNIDF